MKSANCVKPNYFHLAYCFPLGLPKELLYLSTNDSATFTSNLRSGFYLSYVGKIMCVGNEAVGKTAITSVLRAKKPTRERKSTEGIDLHVFKAAVDINERKWVLTGRYCEHYSGTNEITGLSKRITYLSIICR